MIENTQVPCCPSLETDRACDILNHHYRLIHSPLIKGADQRVQVEVIIRTRLERCPGPFALGDMVYTTTLLPGEKVRLFTTDRRSRFTFDNTTKVSYRNEQTSEEHFYMASMNDFMSDINVKDVSRAINTNSGSSTGHGGTSGLLESIFGGPSVDIRGTYNSVSTSEFLKELSEHVKASHHRSEMGARASSTISIGEVETRTHISTESEDHFESSSREFSNSNKCHAVTFFFYRINKIQTIKYSIESIDRRVIDQAANSKVTNNAFVSQGDVSVIPSNVLAVDKSRLEIEKIGRDSAEAKRRASQSVSDIASSKTASVTNAFQPISPISPSLRRQALEQVDKELVEGSLLDNLGGSILPDIQKQFSFEVQSSLPTPGILVKGCLDECSVCETELIKEIELNLERKRLENELLKRQIELLDKAQEYRCCPKDLET
jgi:hypothetical protein